MISPSPSQTRVNCLPTYILIDTSSSMKKVEDSLNDTIEYLYDELITSPRISDFAHVCGRSFRLRKACSITDSFSRRLAVQPYPLPNQGPFWPAP